MSWGTYLVVFAVVLVGATVQSSTGFGQALVAAPILRMVHPELLPGALLIAGLLISTGVVVRDGRPSDIAQVGPAVAGRLVGIAAAVVLVANLSERGLTIAIGVLVLGFIGARIGGLRIAKTKRTLVGTGVVSGVAGTIAALGGTPMALLYEQHARANAFRGPLAWYSVLGTILTMVGLAIGGQFGWSDIALGLSLVPPIVMGLVLSRWVVPVVDRGLLGPIVLTLSASAATILLVSAVF